MQSDTDVFFDSKRYGIDPVSDVRREEKGPSLYAAGWLRFAFQKMSQVAL